MNLLNIDNDSESFSKVDPFKNAALKNYNEFLSTYGLVDLGLPSGTLWSTIDLCHPYASSFPKQELKEIHENHPISTYPWETTKLEDFVLEHIDMYSIPTKQQAAELIHNTVFDHIDADTKDNIYKSKINGQCISLWNFGHLYSIRKWTKTEVDNNNYRFRNGSYGYCLQYDYIKRETSIGVYSQDRECSIRPVYKHTIK